MHGSSLCGISVGWISLAAENAARAGMGARAAWQTPANVSCSNTEQHMQASEAFGCLHVLSLIGFVWLFESLLKAAADKAGTIALG